ncbi:MAG TPA: glucosylceramidase, partial [Mucilaginibacter sp.]
MNTQIKSILLSAVLLGITAAVNAQTTKASLWLTKADRSVLFEQQKEPLTFKTGEAGGTTITVDDKQHYQPIDGFGFALTGGSAMHIIRMSAESRAALLKNLFAITGNDIGISYLRLSIGASDLNEKVFSYDDMPEGQTDPTLKHFDLGPDKTDVVPVMKQILAINPAIKILGSPWSPPAWMKTNNDTRGGRLKPGCYPVYAKY